MCRLKWWFFFCVSFLSGSICFLFGLTQALWAADATKLGPLILLLYFGFSGYIGYLTYRAEIDRDRYSRERVQMHLKSCDLMVKSMVILGIIGTAAGLLLMLNSAFAGDMNPTMVLAGLKKGLSTLGISTLVGLVCYLLLEVQVVNLEYALES
jgi:hypothetical protein